MLPASFSSIFKEEYNAGKKFEIMIQGIWIALLVLSQISPGKPYQNSTLMTRCVRSLCESGIGLYPHCDDCSKFIYCIFGHAIEKGCPHLLIFDIKLGVCNYPQSSQCWQSNRQLGNREIKSSLNREQRLSITGMSNSFKPSDELVGESYKEHIKDIHAPNRNISQPTHDGQNPQPGFSNHVTQRKENSKDENQLRRVEQSKNEDINGVFETSLITGDTREIINNNETHTGLKRSNISLNQDGEAPIHLSLPSEQILHSISRLNGNREVTAKTDDPPLGLNSEHYENIGSSIDLEDTLVLPIDELDAETVLMDDTGAVNTDDPPEEWNRDYTINPDFQQGEEQIVADTASNDQHKPEKIDTNSILADGVDTQKELTKTKSVDTNSNYDEGVGSQKVPKATSTVHTESVRDEGEGTQNVPVENKTVDTDSIHDEGVDTHKELPAETMTVNTDSIRGKGVGTHKEPEVPVAPESVPTTARYLVPCVKDCTGLPVGDYQSCADCTRYTSCIWGISLENICASGKFWDDIYKLCVAKSSTCF